MKNKLFSSQILITFVVSIVLTTSAFGSNEQHRVHSSFNHSFEMQHQRHEKQMHEHHLSVRHEVVSRHLQSLQVEHLHI